MIYSFACTRSKTLAKSAQKLDQYFALAKIKHHWLVGAESIFQAYQAAMFQLLQAHQPLQPTDLIVFCHDDIEIWDDIQSFLEWLSVAAHPQVGFIGVAGTTVLGSDGVWWESRRRKAGLHRGFVWQGSGRDNFQPNYFGPPGDVVVLDGCFLALSVATASRINFAKPDYFKGDWDFYDLYYTMQTYQLNLRNIVVPIHILHNSAGNLVGRTSWHQNREAFIAHHRLPAKTVAMDEGKRPFSKQAELKTPS